MKRVLCIWFPDWPIQRLVVDLPELKTKSLVLHARDSQRGQRVVACCERARLRGVVPQMPLAEVAALKGGTSFSLQEHRPEQDEKALAELAMWCEQFSPIVGLEQCPSPSSLFLDATGLETLFGGESNFVNRVTNTCRKRGYCVRARLGSTVGQSWALAHFGSTDAGTEQGTAELERELNSLPVGALRLSEETVATLRQLGVTSIGQLRRLPRSALAARFDESLIARIDQAFGLQAEVIVAYRPPPEFCEVRTLEHSTDRQDVIFTLLSQLTRAITDKLRENDHATVQLQAIFQGETSKQTLQVSLFQPSNNPQHIDQLWQLQLETLRMDQPIQKVSLSAITTVRLSGKQHTLWEGQAIQHELASLIDRLTSRLGTENVFAVQSQAAALPERAYRRKAPAEVIRPRRKTRAAAAQGESKLAVSARLHGHRPLWLCPTPQPIRIISFEAIKTGTPASVVPSSRKTRHEATTAAASSTPDTPPPCFQLRDTMYRVAHFWGPERIETGWWRGRSVRRDYYRVETTSGYRLWIFRCLSRGVWFLHGYFE